MYIDVILIENIIINYLILYTTAVVAKYKSTPLRFFLGSLAGALYIIPMFFYKNSFFRAVPLKLMLSALIVVIVFYPSRLKDFVRLLSFFYLSTMIFGGVGFSLYYLPGKNGYIYNGIFVFDNISVILIIVTASIGCYLIYYCIAYVKKIHKSIVEMDISIDKKTITTLALMDTGNTLYEPINHRPVIIIEFDVLERIMPDSVKEYLIGLDKNSIVNFDGIDNIEPQWIKRFRLLPFKDIGKENGMLLGIKPDSLKIYDEYETKEINDVILGVYFNKLSNTNEYFALLHTDLLTD